jgi:hypothetical protein
MLQPASDRAAASAIPNELVGLQRVAFARAARRQRTTLFLQVIIALVAGVTVYVPERYGAYPAALITMLLGIAYAMMSWFYKDARYLAERIRRITLLAGGLGSTVPTAERQDILARFSQKSLAEGTTLADPSYFTAHGPPSAQCLAEMLEESAFWTYHQLRLCAKISWITFGVFLFLFIFMLFSILPFITTESALSNVRVICAMLILLVSNDVFGNAQDYTTASVLFQILSFVCKETKPPDTSWTIFYLLSVIITPLLSARP